LRANHYRRSTLDLHPGISRVGQQVTYKYIKRCAVITRREPILAAHPTLWMALQQGCAGEVAESVRSTKEYVDRWHPQ
jgi:hypothetical protein